MACCAVGAYIVFRFLNIHEKLCTLYPRQSHVEHSPAQRPKSITGAQVSILSLDGLTCASCVSDVEDIIRSIPGVLKATRRRSLRPSGLLAMMPIHCLHLNLRAGLVCYLSFKSP
ncbi:hypothetical protein LB505_014515 [Fusarium chuoi]|nr:hypothetical protein LB505_014515 [Fusarium chuoi]